MQYFWSEKSKNGRKLVICHELIAKNGQNLRNSAQKSPKMDENSRILLNQLLTQSKNGQKSWIFCLLSNPGNLTFFKFKFAES